MFALTAYTPGFTADDSRFTGTVNLQICLSLYQFSGKNKQISEKGKNIFAELLKRIIFLIYITMNFADLVYMKKSWECSWIFSGQCNTHAELCQSFMVIWTCAVIIVKWNKYVILFLKSKGTRTSSISRDLWTSTENCKQLWSDCITEQASPIHFGFS